MEKPDNNSADQTNKEKMDQWIKEHEDSLDYPDVPVGKRDYEFDESGLSPEVKKALAEREAQLAKKKPGVNLVLKATQFAALKHRDQRRKDHAANPYIIHPVTVANKLTQAGIVVA